MKFDFQGKWYLFSRHAIESIDSDRRTLNSFPIVYIIVRESDKLAYVGETTNLLNRMTSHLKHPDKKKLEKVFIISSVYLNKSAALDIESNLIQHMPYLGFKLLNANAGFTNHQYYQKQSYNELFERIWENLSFEGIKTSSLLEIQNSDIFKYSPYKSLTDDQYASVVEILNILAGKASQLIFVDGCAGTGKTVLAIYLIKLLSGLHRYKRDELGFEDEHLLLALAGLKKKFPNGLKVGFVVPMSSLRKTIKKVFSQVYGLTAKMVVGPNDVAKHRYDLIIVDEAHRLTRRKGITGYRAFDNVNKRLKINDESTQLDWIMACSQAQILFYDAEQSIKPADVRKEDFDSYKKQANQVKLISQLRSKGGYDYIAFVDKLLRCQLDESHPKFDSDDYELLLFENMNDMIKKLQDKENEVGLARLMSGYCWKWKSTENPDSPDAVIDNVRLTWNKVTSDWINSTTDVREMGCIHTVQGYDLNYAAVIFGEEISYNPTQNSMIIKKECYHDAKGKVAIKDESELLDYIIKIYKTMMYRAIEGSYVYVCDPALRQYMSTQIPVITSSDLRGSNSPLYRNP